MPPTKKKLARRSTLKSGRPPLAIIAKKKTLSSRTTQKTISTFHRLQKDLALAQASGQDAIASQLQAQITQLGGIKAYQAASILGQSADRGGDSSIVLMKWLEPVKRDLLCLRKTGDDGDGSVGTGTFRMLEVGALSTKNACSRSGCFAIERIDLNAQEKEIQQQDFMERPLPPGEGEKFDVISLSLVLNFVPEAKGRGEMLKQTTRFLRKRAIVAEGLEDGQGSSSEETFSSSPTPARLTATNGIPAALTDYRAILFLVLPASCVLNSRYFNDERLTLIMASLGYAMLQRKTTAKLVYYLWQWRDQPAPNKEQEFKKVKVRDGPGMNNFYIELRPEG